MASHRAPKRRKNIDGDRMWAEANNTMLDSLRNEKYKLYTVNLLNFCSVLRKEGKILESLKYQLQFVILEMNGPQDFVLSKETRMRSFDLKSINEKTLDEVLEYQAKDLTKSMRLAGIPKETLRELFLDNYSDQHKRFNLPIDATSAWRKFSKFVEGIDSTNSKDVVQKSRKWVIVLTIVATIVVGISILR